MKLLLFFIDGLGLGANNKFNPAVSFLEGIAGIPFCNCSLPAEFPEGVLSAADASGGIPGLPQSATGQTMLMCGVNAPAMLGYHLTAFPNKKLVNIIKSRNILSVLRNNGITAAASNLYTEEFFLRREKLSKERGKNIFPVSTLSILSSGTPVRYIQDYNKGKALFADLTNNTLRERGYEIPLITPEEAAGIMAGILDENDFVFHEYFVTDIYAHKKRFKDLERILKEINIFLRTLRKLTDPEETAILVVSDHGNCEYSLSSDHTRNPVPILLLSRNAASRRIFRNITRLENVKAGIIEYFGLN